jgi:hypothetical protein
VSSFQNLNLRLATKFLSRKGTAVPLKKAKDILRYHVLYDRVLPFYESQGISVEHILTDNGREYCGRPMIHPYQIFLELNDIEHRRTKVARPRTNGFVERFNRTVLDEFLRETFRDKFYTSVEELQEDLDRWLHHYNYERPHRGYRNMGRRPIETIEASKVIKE